MAFKKKLSTMLALAAMACLSACAVDLGEFEKGDGYKSLYDSLGDVDALYDGGKETYDVEESLFNAKTVQEFKWEKEEYEVKQHQYLYIINSIIIYYGYFFCFFSIYKYFGYTSIFSVTVFYSYVVYGI